MKHIRRTFIVSALVPEHCEIQEAIYFIKASLGNFGNRIHPDHVLSNSFKNVSATHKPRKKSKKEKSK